MGVAAQCLICQYARRDDTRLRHHGIPLPSGCARFENNTDERSVLNALLYQNAGERRCPAYQHMRLEPDAYWAEDLPRAPIVPTTEA